MRFISLFLVLFFTVVQMSCARVNVGGTEKPIKVDVTMRVDIYQHVVQQADDIENMIRGNSATEPQQETQGEPQSFLNLFISNAWAAELSPEAQQAVEGRKARLDKVNQLLTSGVVGENNQGRLEIRQPGNAEAENIVSAENADREKIYADLAAQNGVSVGEIKSIYAEKMQALAPSGSIIQNKDGSWLTK